MRLVHFEHTVFKSKITNTEEIFIKINHPETLMVVPTLKPTLEQQITELEQEIQRHQQFQQRASLFTFVGIDNKYKVMEYGYFNENEKSLGPNGGSHTGNKGKPIGLLKRESDSDPRSIHFLDDTSGEVLQYFTRIKIETTLDLNLEFVTTTEYRDGYDHYIYRRQTVLRTYNPAIVFFPNVVPVHFYMEWIPNHDPIDDLRIFKEYILGEVLAKKSKSTERLNKIWENIRLQEEVATEERERVERMNRIYDETTKKSGIKI